MEHKENLFLFVMNLLAVSCRSVIVMQEAVMGVVGAENYTYYSLAQPGSVLVILHSLTGDADLYISEGNVRPTYDIDNYDLQSTTCGLDYQHIPSSFLRPITIGVYGHPSHESSLFQLEIFVEDSSEEEREKEVSYYSHEQNQRTESNEMPDKRTHKPQADSLNESESFLWTIVFGVLKVLFDILVD